MRWIRGKLIKVMTLLCVISLPTIEGSAAGEQSPCDTLSAEFASTESGLQYRDIEVGKGREVSIGDTAKVHYTGWLPDANCKKFDSSRDRGEPFSFRIGAGQVIKGWEEGVSTMRKGGKRLLLIPPHLGYGERGAANVIPPNARLLFEVEVVDLR